MNPSRLLVLAATLLAVPAAAQPPAAPTETLSVSGTGRVELTPDRAVFSVGVQTMAPTVAAARAKAEVLTRAAGRTLGRVFSIAEGGGGRPPVPMAFELKAMSRSAEVPIETGTEEMSFSVSVSFELR